ncbi:Galactose oxidase [Cercospora beticola]|nr:Galactose oxidase [Cercospora beticola]PIA88912.1 Galactose oxidase [Cercospora beticola]
MCGNLAPGQDDSGCNRAIDHPDGEIFSPPYLFNDDMSLAERPIIFSVDSSMQNGRVAKAGSTITVNMNYPTQHTLALVRMGSATHSVNSDQRRIPLNNVQRSNAAHIVTLPSDSGILIPGFYYLFAMNERGVPSVAKTLQIVL